MSAVSARELALRALLAVFERGRTLDEAFAGEPPGGEPPGGEQPCEEPLAARDLAFARELAYGVCRWYFALRERLASWLKKPLRARDRDVEIILLLGLYQLLVLGTDAHAAVNESVALVPARKQHRLRGLVNAVLRAAAREDSGSGSLDAAASYPSWMLARMRADWPAAAASILAAGNTRPPMTMRVDTTRWERAQALAALAEAGVEAQAHPRVVSAIVLADSCDPVRLPGFADGRLSVQDAAAQLAAGLLDCAAGERVLDACAAPGGKTLHLLEAHPGIELEALDVSASRLERVAQNLARAGRSARLIVGDATTPEAWFDGHPYAAILADLPCSASGVIRRHPDIKLLRREADLAQLADLQTRIVAALWPLLAPGGRILYATCSIFRDENELRVATLLDRLPGAAEIELPAEWGERGAHGRQILPGSDGMDGFYYALLEKAAP